MNAYSKALRLRVLAGVDRRTPRKGVVETFSVSLATVKRWLKRRLKTGGAETRPSPNLTLKEHCEASDEEHGVAVSTATR